MDPVLIVTRPAPAGPAFADAVQRTLGRAVPVVIAPALRIVPVPYEMPPARGLVFTSARAVAFAPEGAGLTAWCVGGATAAAAAGRGYDVRDADGDAEALVALILAARPDGPLVHLAGRHRRGEIAARLTAAGVSCRAVTVYDQVQEPVPPALIAAAGGPAPLVAPVFSPRSAQGLLSLRRTAPLTVIAISPAVAADFAGLPDATVLTVGHPDADHMREMCVAVLRGLSDE